MYEFPRAVLARINLAAADAIARQTALRDFRLPLRRPSQQWGDDYVPSISAPRRVSRVASTNLGR